MVSTVIPLRTQVPEDFRFQGSLLRFTIARAVAALRGSFVKIALKSFFWSFNLSLEEPFRGEVIAQFLLKSLKLIVDSVFNGGKELQVVRDVLEALVAGAELDSVHVVRVHSIRVKR